MFVFSNITIKVETIKIGNKMNMAKTMNKSLEKSILTEGYKEKPIYPSVN